MGTSLKPWVRRRWVIGVAIALVSLYPLYLIAANVALASGALPKFVNGQTADLHLEVAHAHTFFPGVVTVRDLRLRFEDRNVQMYMTIADATVHIDLFALTKKTFHLTKVRGSGIHYWFRHRLKDADDALTQRRVQAYPPIPGVDPIPLFSKEPPPPPLTDADYNLFTIQMEDIDVTTEELWFLEVRYVGRGHAKGAFKLKPVRRLFVDATLQLDGGMISMMPDDLAPIFSSGIKIDVPDFDVNEPKGLEVLRKVSAQISADAHFDRLPLSDYGLEGVELTKKGADLHVGANIAAGVPEKDTGMTFQGPVTYGSKSFSLYADTKAGVRVPTDGKVELSLALGSGGFSFRGGGEKATHTKFALRDVAAKFLFSQPDLAADPQFAGGALHAKAIDTKDVGFLAPYMGEKVPHSGELHAEADVTIAPSGAMNGDATASVTNLALHWPTIGVEGAGVLKAKLRAKEGAASGTLAEAKLDFPALTILQTKIGRRTTWLTIEADSVQWQGFPPKAIHIPFSARGGNSAVVSGFVERGGGIPAFIAKELGSGGPFSATGRVDLLPWETQFILGSGRSGSITGEGGVVIRDSSTRGAFLVHALGLTNGIHVDDSGPSLSLLSSTTWLNEELKKAGAQR